MPLSDQGFQPDTFANIDAVFCVEPAEEIAGFWRSYTLQNALCHLDQYDLQPKFGRDRCRLKPDISPTDDQHPLARLKPRRHRINIRQTANHMDPVQLPANRGRQAVRRGPCRQHQRVIPDRIATDMHDLGRPVDPVHRLPHAQINTVLGIKRLWPQEHPFQHHVTHQVSLGQRRALIGRHVFLSDQGDLALKPSIAKFDNTR